MRKPMMMLAAEGSTGGGGVTSGAGTGQGTAGAAGGGAGTGQGTAGGAAAAGQAGAGAAGAGASAAAGASGQGEGAKGGSSFAASVAGTDGQGAKGGEGTAGTSSAATSEPYKLALPEGVSNVDEKLLTGFTKLANDSKLPKEAAQGVLDFYVKQVQEQQKADVAALQQRQAEQRKALESHPRLGGANLAKSQEFARRAVLDLDRRADGLGTKFTQALVEIGEGDNPIFAELLTRVGEGLAEDSTGNSTGGDGGKRVTGPEARAQKKYPNTTAAISRETPK